MLALLFLLASSTAVAETRLPAGSVVAPAHISGCASPCALIGRQVTRTVFEGRTISLADTAEPDMVKRNAIVTMVAVKGRMRLEATGRALDAGPKGARISVMNDETKRVVQGVVTGPDRVEMSL